MSVEARGQTLTEGASAFLAREAWLLDEHDYEAWLELWADDGVYWIPADGEATDPTRQVSFINDNRARLEMRVRQMQTGYRWAQLPQSRTQHFISNIEVSESSDPSEIRVRSAYLVMEARFGDTNVWPGRAEHLLRRIDDGDFEIARKKVTLVHNDQPVPAMGFLL